MIGALPQTPEFIAFVFPKMGRKNRRQKSAAHFGVKSVQPLRSHSCVAVSCRTEKANYIINNCLKDYSIYTVCATLPQPTGFLFQKSFDKLHCNHTEYLIVFCIFFVSICIILYFYKIIAQNQTIKTLIHIPIFDRLFYRKMLQFSYKER